MIASVQVIGSRSSGGAEGFYCRLTNALANEAPGVYMARARSLLRETGHGGDAPIVPDGTYVGDGEGQTLGQRLDMG